MNSIDPNSLNNRREGLAARAVLGVFIGACALIALREFLLAVNAPRETVRGRVLLDGVGVPAELGLFAPSARGSYTRVAKVTAARDGHFAISIPSEHLDHSLIVTATWHRRVVDGEEYVAGANLLPVQYASPETSPQRLFARDALHTESLIKLTCCSAI